MDVLQQIIKKQGTNAVQIDLEFKQIENLEELLPLLANFTNLKELNLHGNRLSVLPEDMSLLDTVEVLDISNNMFRNVFILTVIKLPQVVEALQSMPNLQHLNINVQSQDEEQYIADGLPNLLSLNQQVLRNEDDHVSQSQSERSQLGQDVTLQQEDLEQMALLFDNIRELQKDHDPDSDQQIQAQFDVGVRNIMKDLQQKLVNQLPDFLQNLHILKAKHSLYEICFKQIIKYFKQTDKKVESILMRIHDQHFQTFNDLLNLVQNNKEPLNEQNQIKKNDIHLDNQVEQRLRQELQELQQQNRELEEENRKYLDTIIRHSKGEKSEHNGKSNNDSYLQIERKQQQPSKQVVQQIGQQVGSVIAPTSVRSLTLKQLKDVINEIYESKQKYDQKFQEAKLPKETMEQHMYTFLNQKYGLKNLIIEWASSIINALKKYAQDDNDVAVFGKILRNECDEEFRFVQAQVKNTMQELLKMYLRGKFPLKHQAEIKEMLNQRINGYIFEEEAVDIIKYMYNQDDSELILGKLKQFYIAQVKQIDKRLTREEQIQMLAEKDKLKLDYSIFQKIILDFQLKSHEKYLKKFIFTFKQMDTDQNGIIDENEFRQLIGILNFNASEMDVQKYLNLIDPYSHQQITFSQCVTLFSSESSPGNTQVSILQRISES